MLIRDLVHMGHEVHHDAPHGDLQGEEHHEVTLLTSCSYPRHVPHLPSAVGPHENQDQFIETMFDPKKFSLPCSFPLHYIKQ